MASERRGLDANVLIYSIAEGAEQQPAAAALFERARQEGADLYVVPQVLLESYAVLSNPKRFQPAFTPEEALTAILSFLALPGLTLPPPPADLMGRWVELARRCSPRKQHTFDIALAAAYLAYDVTTLYTFNIRDFDTIPGLESIEPSMDVNR